MRYALLLVLAGAVLTGCLSAVPYEPVQRYSIVPDTDVEARAPQAGSIAVRPLSPAQPYTTSMVYRPDEFTVAYRPVDEWAESPRDAVTRALLDALASTNYFSDVGTASNVPLPDYILTGQLRRFDEMRTTSPPHALCEIRIEVRENRRPARSILTQSYRESVPLEDPSGAALAEAMTRAVSVIVSNAAEDVVEAVAEAGAEEGD